MVCFRTVSQRPLLSVRYPVNDNDPVLTSMELRLGDLREHYRLQPNEHTRYQLVRYEQLIEQWAPGRYQAL